MELVSRLVNQLASQWDSVLTREGTVCFQMLAMCVNVQYKELCCSSVQKMKVNHNPLLASGSKLMTWLEQTVHRWTLIFFANMFGLCTE